MLEREYASIPKYTKHAMFTITLVTKQLKWGIAVVESIEGLTGSASVQLPHYDGVEPMEILNQISKVSGATDTTKEAGRCFSCQEYGHRARECPSPQAADAKLYRPARPRAVQAERCDRCSMYSHTAVECRADWETAARCQRRAGHRPNASRARPAVTHLGEEAPPLPPAAAAPAAVASNAAPKFCTVPARINLMSGPYKAAQVTGFGHHYMGVEEEGATSVADLDLPDLLEEPAKMKMILGPASLPCAQGPRMTTSAANPILNYTRTII